jgi:dicarboxylate/amino acid:cation (Na+ or H+) symporter, DAACS family
MKLHTRILIGLTAGVAIGAAARSVPALAAVVEWLEPAGTIFIRLITMVVLPLVIASLFVGVTSLGDIRRLGRIGGRTLAYFLITTVLAAIIGTTVALVARVGTGLDPAVRDSIAGRFNAPGAQSPTVSGVPTFVQTIVAMVPQNPIAAAAQGDLLAVIFTVIVFGAAATSMSEEKRRPLVSLGQAVNDVSLIVIQFLMRLAPVAVGILIAATVLRSGIDLLWSLAGYATVVIAGLALHVVLVLLPLLQFVARIGVVAFLQAVGHVILLAFSTASSSVTLPVSLAAARERLGVSAAVASFVLPIGTTLNKNGAAVYKAATAVFLAHLYGVDLGAGQLATIVLTTIVASSAGAGVPGSSLVTTLIVLNAIGLGSNASAGIALIAGIDRPLDMCRTAVNTFSNLVGTAVVARAEGERVRALPSTEAASEA